MTDTQESNLQYHLTKVWTRHNYKVSNPPVNTPHGVLERDHEVETDADTEMTVRGKSTPVSRVTMNLSHTTNLGNYNSMRIEVGIDVPVPLEQIDASVPLIHSFLMKQLQEAHMAAGPSNG